MGSEETQLTLAVSIPTKLVEAMGADKVRKLLEAFINEGEGVEFLQEQYEDETGIWTKT